MEPVLHSPNLDSQGDAPSHRAEPAPPPALARPAAPTRSRRERRRRLMRWLRRGLLAITVLALGGAVVLALRPRAVEVDVARAVRGPLETVIEESGKTRVQDRFVVSAPVSGHLSRVLFEPGDAVHQGERLAELAPAISPLLDSRTRAAAEARLSAATSAAGQAQAQRVHAEAARDLAQQELSRQRRLAASDATSQQGLDQAEFSARMRAQELDSARFAEKVAAEEVREARVAAGHDGTTGAGRHIDALAPASGRVLRVFQKSAGVVAAGTPLVEVGDPAVLEVVVDLLTTDAVRVQPGTAVQIEGWGGDQPLAGRVRRVEPSAFTKLSALGVDEQRVDAIVALTAPRAQWGDLGDGFHVEARIVLWRGAAVLQVPLGALFRDGGRWAVYRVERDLARLVPVEIGHRGDSAVEIVAGLSADDEVIVHAGDRVHDRVAVRRR